MPSDHLFSRTRFLLHNRDVPIRLSISTPPCRRSPCRFQSNEGSLPNNKPPVVDIDPLVDINSLENTLDAHQAANRASLSSGRRIWPRRPAIKYHRPTPRSQTTTVVSVFKENKKKWKEDEGKDFKLYSFAKAPEEKRELKEGSSSRFYTPDAGRVVDHTFHWKLNKTIRTPTAFRLPWINHYQKPLSPWMSAEEQLSADIQAFDAFVSPTWEEQQAAEMALNDLRQVIKNINQHMDIDVIGSRATGTANPLSDIDINVSVPVTPSSIQSRIDPHMILNTLQRSIQNWRRNHQNFSCPIQTVFYVKNAVVPILLCRHKATMLPIQIQSTPRTFDSTEYVRSFLKEYPTLRYLFRVLRQALQMRGLTNGQHGGLTSYPLLNMIVASLKLSEGKSSPFSAASHLIFFLDMYCEIDFDTTGISTRPLGYFSKLEYGQTETEKAAVASGRYEEELEGQRQMRLRALKTGRKMVLQDPANPMNNLGKSATRIRDLQETLISLREKLKQAMSAWDERLAASAVADSVSREPSHPNKGHSLLAPLLEGDYRNYLSERSDLVKSVKDNKPRVMSSVGDSRWEHIPLGAGEYT